MKIEYVQGFPKVVIEDDISYEEYLSILELSDEHDINICPTKANPIENSLLNEFIQNTQAKYLVDYLALYNEYTEIRTLDYTTLYLLYEEKTDNICTLLYPAVYLCFPKGIKSDNLFYSIFKKHRKTNNKECIYIRLSNGRDYRVANRTISTIFGAKI